MRLDDAGPRTWLLGAAAAWALGAWLLAVAGMGGRIAPLDADPALERPLPEPAAPAPERLGPLADYGRIAARPLLSPNRRPQPFSLEPESEAARPEERFEYLLTGVLMSPTLQMAIVQPANGGEPERIRIGQGPEAAPSWRLVSLSPRAAVFEGPDGEQSLALRSYDGGADIRVVPRPRPSTRRTRADARRGAATPVQATPVPATPVQMDDAADDGSAPPAPDAVQEADAPGTPQEQMEAIRNRIEARREQLRREAQGTQPPQQR